MTKRDRAGNEIGLLRWAELRSQLGYMIVAEDAAGAVTVRTVWEGMDEPPGLPGVMFSTGVATAGTDRFATVIDSDNKADALARHQLVVEFAHTDHGDPSGAVYRLRAALVAAVTDPGEPHTAADVVTARPGPSGSGPQ